MQRAHNTHTHTLSAAGRQAALLSFSLARGFHVPPAQQPAQRPGRLCKAGQPAGARHPCRPARVSAVLVVWRCLALAVFTRGF